MALNVTTAVFGENCNTATASPSLAQWDTEQLLQISGIDLPDSYKVEFSTVYTRNAIPEIGDASGVTIPNVLLQRSAPITAYIVLYGENGGRNREYWITIYITPGQPPETITPDPEQADVIDQAIAALNNGVARTEAAATSAEGSARDAEAAAVAVQNLSVAAETLATGEPATVEKTVDEETGAVTLNFGLPRGAKGDPLTYEELTPEQKAELVQGPILEAQNAAVTAVRNARTSAVDAVGSAGTTQVNAVNQAGTTQTGAVNQAGANQVAAVNQAGATQVQTVEDKGNEVLDSIPPDYTDLVDDVADLSQQLSGVEDAVSDETTGLDTKAPVILETVSGAIASFDDGADGMPIRKIVATIEPVQAAGTPSPDNPLPISGWTGCTISHSGADTTNPDTLAINWETEAGTIYGGTLDVTSGILTVDRAIDTIANMGFVYQANNNRFFTAQLANVIKAPPVTEINTQCESLYARTWAANTYPNPCTSVAQSGNIFIFNVAYTSVEELTAAIGTSKFCYELATPVEYQLTPQEMLTLYGQNNIWSSTGDVEVTYPADTKAKVSDLTRQINHFDDNLPGTVQTVNFGADGKPSSVVHTKNGATVRTDAYTWGDGTVTETRTTADGSYITMVTDLSTLVTTISEIQEAS